MLRKKLLTRSTHPIQDWWWKMTQRWPEKQSKSMESQIQWRHSSFRETEKGSVGIFWAGAKNKEIVWSRGFLNISVYPVKHVCPTLHSDALENCQHGEEYVVEVCDATIRTLPLAPALSSIADTKASAASESTRWRVILHHQTLSTQTAADRQEMSSLIYKTSTFYEICPCLEFREQRPVPME